MAALSAAAADTKQVRHSCCSPPEPAGTAPARLSDKSLYQLDSSWTNDDGAAVKLAALRGRPQVLVMFFAHCVYACPLLVYQMQQLEAALPEGLRDKVGFTLVSFDSERDTPAALHQYRLQHGLEKGRWTLLHGGPDDVLELAALLNVKYKKDAQGQFLHSNVMTLLNAEGEIVCQQQGLNSDRKEILQAMRSIVNNSNAGLGASEAGRERSNVHDCTK
ncbi:MAG TPA: SCO family protein [Candidatus Acidoferrum sp.]|nr:SCO family protein [Candidatus Acidoferrum sp.]